MPLLIDFSGIADASPYTNAQFDVIGGAVKVENGVLDVVTPATSALFVSKNAAPVDYSQASVKVNSDENVTFDPRGPALVKADGSGYYGRVEGGNVAIHRLGVGGTDQGEVHWSAKTTGVDFDDSDTAVINYAESTNTITVSLDGVDMATYSDNTVVPTSSDPFYPAAFVRWGNAGNGGVESLSGGAGQAPVVYDTLTDLDIAAFTRHIIEGAVGGDQNNDGTSSTGHMQDAITAAADGSRVSGAWSLYSQYDMAAVAFSQIDYFESLDTPPAGFDKAVWLQAVTAYHTLYMGDYILPNNYGVLNYYRYTEGLREMYLRKQADPTLNIPTVTQAVMQSMRDDFSYSDLNDFRNPTYSPWTRATRELAYLLQAHVDAEKCGVARDNVMLDACIDAAKVKFANKQLQTARITGSYTPLDGSAVINYDADHEVQKPFMMGLLANALLDLYDWEVQNGRGSESRIADIPATVYGYLYWLTESAVVVSGNRPDTATLGTKVFQENALVNTRYNKTLSGFRYVDRNNNGLGGDEDTESLWFDLNALIAPAYYWIAKHYEGSDQSKSDDMLAKADKLFFSAMYKDTNRRLGFFQGGKQYNQQTRWAIKALNIREEIINPSDDVPEAFIFADISSGSPNQQVESTAVTITGLNTKSDVSITGGEYAISTDSGSTWGSWTNSDGEIENDDQIKIRVQTDAEFEKVFNAVINIGGVSDTFTVTTRAAITPVVSTQPTPQEAAESEDITLTVAFDDEDSVQWYEQDGQAVSGATSESWTFEASLLDDQKVFYAEATSVDGVKVRSNMVKITVTEKETALTRFVDFYWRGEVLPPSIFIAKNQDNKSLVVVEYNEKPVDLTQFDQFELYGLDSDPIITDGTSGPIAANDEGELILDVQAETTVSGDYIDLTLVAKNADYPNGLVLIHPEFKLGKTKAKVVA